MFTKIYLSNISPNWPFDRQDKLLRELVPEYPDSVKVFRDELEAPKRQAHKASYLENRAMLLRASTRKATELIILPSLAVFDWTIAGMLACLTQAAARNAIVRVLDADLEIGLKPSPAMLNKAIAAFHKAREKDRRMDPGSVGGKISGKSRWDKADAIAQRYKADWETSKLTSEQIAKKSGLSVNTLKDHLGKREDVRRKISAADARKKTIAARRQKAEGANA